MATGTRVFLNSEDGFHGHDLTPTYDDGEIIEVIRVCISAVWMVTNLVTKHL